MEVEESHTTTVLRSRRISPFLFIGFCSFVAVWALALDVAAVELSCHGGTCRLDRRALAHERGAFGSMRGALAAAVPRARPARFAAARLTQARIEVVTHPKKSPTYKLFLDLAADADGGREAESLALWEFSREQDASDLWLTIQAALEHARLRANDGAGLALHARVDAAWWDELCLLAALVGAAVAASLFEHAEAIVVARDAGVVVVERRTPLTALRGALGRGAAAGGAGAGAAGSAGGEAHVLLLAPVDAVEVAETHAVRPDRRAARGDRRRDVDVWGLELRWTRGGGRQPPVQLRLGEMTPHSRANADDARALREALRIARGAAEASAARRRLAAEEGLREVGNGGAAAGGVGGGGDPGGRCVVCLEKVARVAFAPCAHVCCCEDCGQIPRLRECPVCRRAIAHRIGLYFS